MNHSQFESLMEKAPLGYAYQKMITDSQSNPFDYRVLMCNNLFERITGVKKANLINRKISEINLSEDFLKFNRMELFNKIAFQGSQESFEAYSQALSVWFHVCVFSPEKGFFITFYTDITDHKVDLKQYENFFDINLDLLCIADKDGRFIKLNKEWEQLLGYNIEELQGRSFLDFIHPDDLHPTKEAMKRLENDEDILNFTNRYRTKNGEYKIIEWRSHPHQGLMYGAARDITKQKKANLELERREKQFSSLFMDSPVSIMIHDKESAQIIEANKKALSVYGVQQVEELNAQDFFGEPPYAQADAIKMMQKVIKEGPQEFEWLSKRQTGDLFWEKVNL